VDNVCGQDICNLVAFKGAGGLRAPLPSYIS